MPEASGDAVKFNMKKKGAGLSRPNVSEPSESDDTAEEEEAEQTNGPQKDTGIPT